MIFVVCTQKNLTRNFENEISQKTRELKQTATAVFQLHKNESVPSSG